MSLNSIPLKGKSVKFDLRQRDFTMNAIAAPLDEVARQIELGEVGMLEKDGKHEESTLRGTTLRMQRCGLCSLLNEQGHQRVLYFP
jgi:hypothetical protein